MQVIKRNGNPQEISFDKITKRIRDLSYGLSKVDPLLIAKETINGIFDGIKTTELDLLSAEICATKTHHHPEYNKLGGRILVSNIIKTTFNDYVSVIQPLYENKIISEKFYNFVVENRDAIQEMFVYERDYLFDFFGMKTLERSYLFKINGKIMERPQHMWMRVAIQLHGNNIPKLKETYDALSEGYFIHATPTLFNSGTNHPQLSSCFLANMSDDSIKGIYETLGECAQISKWAGGIGLSIHNVRARGSKINGTNGESTGIVPMLKVYNDTAKYVNQGGKRNGSFAIYLEPWHADIEDFLRLKLNQGAEEDRARDLFYGLWIPDLFM
jgi:ribonucleoside-diphosphate reductase alpha chain